MTKLADRNDIPTLPGGWVTLAEAATVLGYTRSYLYKLAAKSSDQGGFKTLHKIGGLASYVVNIDEVTEKLSGRPSPEVELGMEEILAKI